VPGALVQIAFSTRLGFAMARFLGWSIAAGIVFGLALSVTGSVVKLPAFERGAL
jgi:monovalent cation:H+ antiporter-2, CPA2 family